MNLDNKINYTYSKCGMRIGWNRNQEKKLQKLNQQKQQPTGARRYPIDKI